MFKLFAKSDVNCCRSWLFSLSSLNLLLGQTFDQMPISIMSNLIVQKCFNETPVRAIWWNRVN